MKKTININLGGMVFQIDEDAFERLSTYIEALKQKFHNEEEQKEIIQDIEYRFAELFSNDLNSVKQVVSMNMVQSAIATMGSPDDFEDEGIFEEKIFSEKNISYEKVGHKKLFRDPKNQLFAGVISGISKYLGIHDAIWLRIAMVLAIFVTGGFPMIPIYVLFWIVMPIAKTNNDFLQMSGDSINLGSIQDQVKKNIDSTDIKRVSARFADKAAEAAPIILKVIGIGFIVLFGFKFIALTMGLFGGGFVLSMINPGYAGLLVGSKTTYYLALISFYLLIATPLLFAIYLALKIFTKKKVNWIVSIAIAMFLFIFSFIGLTSSAYSVAKNFKGNAEQTNFVALEDPTVEELNIEFPYQKIKDELSLNINFGITDDDNNIKIDGFKVFSKRKEIHINSVGLDILKAKSDTIFKLSKTILSKGKNNEDAEERLSHIHNEFDIINENSISIPRLMILENETKWRVQQLNYRLFVPVGKKIYFGDYAKKVIDDVDFNGDYSKKDLANNTWQMTRNGLKCITCGE